MWFRWTAPAAGTAVLSTAGTRAGPPATAVYLGDRVDVLTAVARHSCGSVLCFRADAGTTYRIALAPAGADGTGAPVEDDLVLHLRLVTPGNDDVATAASLPGTSGQRSLAVRGSAEPGEPAHAEAPAVASRWYRWAPDVDGIAAIDVDGAARVAAYDASFGDGGVDDLRVLDEAAGSAAAPAGLRFPVVAGDPVLVAVDRWPDGPHAGDGRVTVHYRVGAPRNDRPDAALGLVAPGSAYGTTLGVTAGGEPALPGADSGAVWFRLPATSAAPTVVQTTGSDFDTVLGVYQATGAGLRLVAADDDAGPGRASLLTVRPRPGRDYVVGVCVAAALALCAQCPVVGQDPRHRLAPLGDGWPGRRRPCAIERGPTAGAGRHRVRPAGGRGRASRLPGDCVTRTAVQAAAGLRHP